MSIDRKDGWRERSTRLSSEATRQRSLERATAFVLSALALLEETLSADFSVRQVIARSGLSRRAFYEIFEGKDDLLIATYEETIRRLVQGLDDKLAMVEAPVERLRVIVDRLFVGSASDERVQHAAVMTREYMRLAVLQPDAMRGAIEPAIAYLRTEIAHAMEVGAIRSDDAAVLAMMLFNFGVAHIPTRVLETRGGGDPTITATAHWNFCRRALGVED